MAFASKFTLKDEVWDGHSGTLPIATDWLIGVLVSLPLQNTPVLEKVQKPNEEKCKRGKR